MKDINSRSLDLLHGPANIFVIINILLLFYLAFVVGYRDMWPPEFMDYEFGGNTNI